MGKSGRQTNAVKAAATQALVGGAGAIAAVAATGPVAGLGAVGITSALVRCLRQSAFLAVSMLILTGLSACSPSGPEATCAELNATIDRNILEMAVSEAEGDSLDKSAMQQSARLAQNNNRLATIMVNLQLQTQNKCLPRQKSIDAAIYSAQAKKCYWASRSAAYETDAAKKMSATVACDFKAWNSPTVK